MNQYNRSGPFIVVLLVCMFVVAIVPRPTQGTHFILASWDYPDEFGQGIEGFVFQENSTGSWVDVPINGQFASYRPWNESHAYSWNYTFLRVECWTYFNSSRVGVASTAEGQLYQQHSISVALGNGTQLWSQQNFTYGTVSDTYDPMWWYMYSVIINYEFVFGLTYEVTIEYEVFYSYEES